MLPKVAIVGRPNVGKSSLLNVLAGRRISIVDNTAGITRDRVSAEVNLDPDSENGHRCELIDTGGFGLYSGEEAASLDEQVEKQIALAVTEADLILFVIDAQAGVAPLDQQVARLLRSSDVKPDRVQVVANKCDHPDMEPQAAEAIGLGFGEPLKVSATTGRGREDLLIWLKDHLEPVDGPPADSELRVAIVGKRNAGKSTLVNALAGADRVIASEVAGTTRDSVDVRFEIDGRSLTAIDTAGVRKRKAIKKDVDYYSLHRALRSIRRADAVILLIDVTSDVSQVDRKLAAEILNHHKPCLIGLNKWDLVDPKVTLEKFTDYLEQELGGLSFAPIVRLSAEKGEGVRDAVLLACDLHRQAGEHVPTGQLNRTFQQILEHRGPSPRLGKQAKIFYVTMPAVHPPTIVLFVNHVDLFDNRYRRYLMNQIRERLPFAEVPIKLEIRPRPRNAPDQFEAAD
ncbi:MAG: ribosome biogenesis GTPase Der [Phycisphaeraceae bacterium]|nr:ribosome biogenesis GTPase Der [Phycisphaeraceae bacterium]